jgi:hypothetical protein
MTITSVQDVVKASCLYTIALSIHGMNAGAFRAKGEKPPLAIPNSKSLYTKDN